MSDQTCPPPAAESRLDEALQVVERWIRVHKMRLDRKPNERRDSLAARVCDLLVEVAGRQRSVMQNLADRFDYCEDGVCMVCYGARKWTRTSRNKRNWLIERCTNEDCPSHELCELVGLSRPPRWD